MTHPKIKCYLCGEEATLLMPDTSRDRIVECRCCANRYKIPSKEFHFFFEVEGKLDNDDKEKLSMFIYSHFVKITSNVIKKVTGKESVGCC